MPQPPGIEAPEVIAIFGPTAVGKTGIAIELAELLRRRGGDPVAVNCDSMQVYRGLEIISGAATAAERERLEHRLVGMVEIDREFSAGRYARLARSEIDGLLASGRTPIVVGGAGLYLRAALAEWELRPEVPAGIRAGVEAELAERGAEALHAELPASVSGRIHVHDERRISRATELLRSGHDPPPDHRGGGELWTARLRHPTALIGIVRERGALHEAIDQRVRGMWERGAGQEALDAVAAGASRTARAAAGFEQFLAGEVEGAATAHRRYARSQLTWMRRMDGILELDRTGIGAAEAAGRALEMVAGRAPGHADE